MLNKFTKLAIGFFIVGIIPTQDLFNFVLLKNILKPIYDFLPLGWTEFGSPIMLILTVILSVFALREKYKSKYDLIINSIILLFAMFFLFYLILFIVAVLMI